MILFLFQFRVSFVFSTIRMVFSISSTENVLSNALAHVTPKHIILYFQSHQGLHTPESWRTRDKKGACWVLTCKKIKEDYFALEHESLNLHIKGEKAFIPEHLQRSLLLKLEKIHVSGFQHSRDYDENFEYELLDLRFLHHPVTKDYQDYNPFDVELANDLEMKYPQMIAARKRNAKLDRDIIG